MGLGGLVAVVGGLWFLFLILREMRRWNGHTHDSSNSNSTPQHP